MMSASVMSSTSPCGEGQAKVSSCSPAVHSRSSVLPNEAEVHLPRQGAAPISPHLVSEALGEAPSRTLGVLHVGRRHVRVRVSRTRVVRGCRGVLVLAYGRIKRGACGDGERMLSGEGWGGEWGPDEGGGSRASGGRREERCSLLRVGVG